MSGFLINTNQNNSDLKENPFGTKHGQEVVSVEENYLARKLRYGRTAYKLYDGTAISTGSIQSIPFTPTDPGKIFIPTLITYTSDVDTILRIAYIPNQYYEPYGVSGLEYLAIVYLKAFTPYNLQLNGELEIHYNGNITYQITAVSASGHIYSCIHGIEVSERA